MIMPACDTRRRFNNADLIGMERIAKSLDRRAGDMARAFRQFRRLQEKNASQTSPVIEPNHPLTTPLSIIRFPSRAYGAFKTIGITTLGELIERTADDLVACDNFGVTTLEDIREVLALMGLMLKSDNASSIADAGTAVE